MNQLFIELYLDEDVDVAIAAMLRSRGFFALTTLHAGNTGKPDDSQLAYACSRQMAIVTHNRNDFQRLAQEYIVAGRHHYGIIIAVRRPSREVARRLAGIMNTVAADEMIDQLRKI